MSDAVGEDRSGWQAVAPWTQDFGMCKATEGTSFEDQAFRGSWAGLKTAGIPRAAYHFFRPALDPVAQARFFVATVRAQGLDEDDGLAVDAELTLNAAATEVMGHFQARAPRMALEPMTLTVNGPQCSHSLLGATVDGAQTWCTHCQQYCGGENSSGQVTCAGCAAARASFTLSFSLQSLVDQFLAEVTALAGKRPCLVYTYQDMAENDFDYSFAAKYPDLWVASYGVQSPGTGSWKTWRFWQSEAGGGPGGGDVDYYNGTARELDGWFAGYRTTPKPPPKAGQDIPGWQHEIITRLPELRAGSQDSGGQVSWVRQAQLLLDIVAVDPVVADGDFGPETEKSVRDVQASRGIAQSGVTDPETWQVLIAGQPSNILPSRVAPGAQDRQGETYWVHRIQAYCETHNVPTGIDGDFGTQTENAVKAVQEAYGIPETGIVDEVTWSLLIAHARP